MNFLKSIGQKIAMNKAKKAVNNIAEKAKNKVDAAYEPKKPKIHLITLIISMASAPFFLIVLITIVIVVVVLSPIEGVINFFNSIGNFFSKTVDFFSFSDSDEKSNTYYKQLQKEYERWKKKGIQLDIPLIAAAVNYGRAISFDANYECEPSIDEAGDVSGCEGEDTDYSKMAKEVKVLSEGMVFRDESGTTRLRTEDEFKKWMMSEAHGISWIEKHLKDVNIDVPTNVEKKKQIFEQSIQEIYNTRDAYAGLMDLVTNSGESNLGYVCPQITITPGEGMYNYGTTLGFEEVVALWLQNEMSGGPEEAMKAHAISNRTSIQYIATKNNCVMKNGTGYGQMGIRTNTTSAGDVAKKAVQDTLGQIMVTEKDEPFWAEVTNFPGAMYYSDEYWGVKCKVKDLGDKYQLSMFKGPSMGTEHDVFIPKSGIGNISPFVNDGQVAHCRGMCQQCILYEAGQGAKMDSLLKEYYDYKTLINLNSGTNTGGGLLSADSSGFRARTNYPTRDNPYYFDAETLGWERGPERCLVGQCVWYVRKRANEMLAMANSNLKFNVIGNANQLYDNNISKGANAFKYSKDYTKPKKGAIIVWGGTVFGHVAVVEDIQGDKVTISQMNYGSSNPGCPTPPDYGFNLSTISVSQIPSYIGLKYIGYIYVLE